LWGKAALVGGEVRWHLIGHLQRNKVEKTLPLVRCIHSVDSVRLLEALEAEAARRQQVVPVLLECNVSGEASKHGFAPAALPGVAPQLSRSQWVHVRGLMTMAPYHTEPEQCRPTCAALRRLGDAARQLSNA